MSQRKWIRRGGKAPTIFKVLQIISTFHKNSITLWHFMFFGITKYCGHFTSSNYASGPINKNCMSVNEYPDLTYLNIDI